MFAQQPYRGGQRSQQHQRGSYRPQHQQSTNQHQQPANQDSSYRNQQQSNQGKVNSANESLPSKSEAPKLTNQNVSNKPVASGSQSAEVKTCIVNPFVPLQVITSCSILNSAVFFKDYKYLTWVRGMDRKICYEGHSSATKGL